METYLLNDPGALSLFFHGLSGDVIWSYSLLEKKYTFVSDSVFKFTGCHASDVIKTDIKWIKPESIEEMISFCRKSLSLGVKPADILLENFRLIICPDEVSQRTALSMVKPLFNEQDVIIGLTGIIFNYEKLNSEAVNQNNFITLFEKVQVTSPYAVFLFDPSGTIINVNQRAADLSGVPRDNLIGRSYICFIQPEEHERIKLIKQILDNDISENKGEYRFKTIEGGWIEIEVRASAIKNIEGDVKAYISVVRDITNEKKLARRKIDDAKNVRALINATTDSVFLVDYEGVILSINRVAVEWLSTFIPALENRVSEDFIGTIIFDYLTEKTKEVFLRERDRVFALAGVIKQKYRVYGRELDMSYYPVKDAEGKIIRFAVYIRDITEKIIEKKKFKKTEDRYGDLVDTMYEGFVIVDRDRRIEYLNRKARELFSGGDDDPEGMDFFSFFNEENREILEENISLALDNRKFRFQVDIISLKRGKLNLLLSVSPVTDDKGNNKGFQAVLTDITGMKKSQLQLQYKADFERLITEISTGFINIQLNEIDDSIRVAIEKIGKFNKEERIYLYQICDDGIHAFNSHEWCSESCNTKIPYRKKINTLDYPSFRNKLLNKEVVHVPDFLKLPEEELVALKRVLKAGTKSCLIVPLILEDSLVGFIGFDSSMEKKWDSDAISLLKMVSVIFVNTLDRRNIKTKLVDVVLQRLSEREIELLGYIVEGYRWPSDKRLLGKIMDVLPGTLDKFMARIKSKMRDDELAQVIDYLRLKREQLNNEKKIDTD